MIRSPRPPLAVLVLALLAQGSPSFSPAAALCSISDWPLDMPQGPADFARVFSPSLATSPPVVQLRTVTRTAGSRATMVGAAGGGAARAEPRDWKANRVAAPSEWQRLYYALMDDDAAQVERLLQSSHIDLATWPAAQGHGSLIDIAAGWGEPDVARVLLAHGHRVRSPPGEPVPLHPIDSAVTGLEGYLNLRAEPPRFFNRPPQSIERFVAVIRLLLEAGADPDVLPLPSDTLTALGHFMFAPRFDGDLDLVRALRAHGASVDPAPPIRSPIGIALDKGYDDYATVMLAGHPSVSARTLNHGLELALAHDNAAMADALLGAGADPNSRAGDMPVLCESLYKSERRAIALALLAHRADANADCGGRRASGETPLTLVDAEDHELIDLLVERGATPGVPAADAAEYRAHGVDPGPLNWALLHRRDHLAAALLARDPQGAHQCGAVLYAARYGAAETLARLFALGADPNARSGEGVSALMVAAYHGQTSALQVLLAQPRIEPDLATPSHVNTGFFHPTLEGRQPSLLYGSRTALMFASLGGSVDAVSLLLAHGAAVHRKDAEGLEASDYARGARIAEALAGGAATQSK